MLPAPNNVESFQHLFDRQMPKEKRMALMLLLQQRPCSRDIFFGAPPPIINLFFHIHTVTLLFIRPCSPQRSP